MKLFIKTIGGNLWMKLATEITIIIGLVHHFENKPFFFISSSSVSEKLLMLWYKYKSFLKDWSATTAYFQTETKITSHYRYR